MFGKCKHKWSKWSTPVNSIGKKDRHDGYGYLCVTQRKLCDDCGLVDIKEVPKMKTVDDLEKSNLNRLDKLLKDIHEGHSWNEYKAKTEARVMSEFLWSSGLFKALEKEG